MIVPESLKNPVMGKTLHNLLPLAVLFLNGAACFAQARVMISEPRLEFRDNVINISYDIRESDPEETYVISLDVRDEAGNPIDAAALSGDIGMVEDGGSGKRITWDLAADSIFMDAYVFLKIHARVIPPPEPVVTVMEETADAIRDPVEQAEEAPPGDLEADDPEVPADDPEVEEAVAAGSGSMKAAEFSRTGLMLQSLAVPGLGLSRFTGKPHWIRAVAGYGCLTGAVILNRKGITTFESVDGIRDPSDAEDAFNRSVRQDNLSEALAFTAIGIWVADILWTWAGTSGLENKPIISNGPGISLGTGIDPGTSVPLISFWYNC